MDAAFVCGGSQVEQWSSAATRGDVSLTLVPFGRTVVVAPGRVNLIGDHTDYTGGFCLPIAIDRMIEVTVTPDERSRVVQLFSETFGTVAEVPLDVGDVTSFQPAWGRYVAAIVKRIKPTRGYVGTVRSTIPPGSGLSSSAALEVAIALALGGAPLRPLDLARLCQEAEHEARGVRTGVLDQLASIHGLAGHALLIDCSAISIEPRPLPSNRDVEIVVVPGPPRSLGSTGYAQRVEQCREIERLIGPLRVATLDDVSPIEDATLRRRGRHVVTENMRVHGFAGAMAEGDVEAAGAIMNESHHSLSEDYESSTRAVDELCSHLRDIPGVLGARITGGGWGGSVVALARPAALAGRGWAVRAEDGASLREIDD
jgi:galactokinase